jgi:hypothetical protein
VTGCCEGGSRTSDSGATKLGVQANAQVSTISFETHT